MMNEQKADLTPEEASMFHVTAQRVFAELVPELNPWAVRRWQQNELLLKDAMREVLRAKGADLDCDLPIITIDPIGPLPLVEKYMRYHELTLESDMDYVAGTFEFELIRFHEPATITVPTTLLVERAKELNGYYGQRHGEALLTNQLLIPWEWRGEDIMLPGTVFKNKFGHLQILKLRVFGRSGWGFDAEHLGGHVISYYRLLHLIRHMAP